MALNNFQINYILKNNYITKKYFIGTFPACQFPDIRKRNLFYPLHVALSPYNVSSKQEFDYFIITKLFKYI